MSSSPLTRLVSRHVCACGRPQATINSISRRYATTTIQYRNVPSPIGFGKSPEELRRKYRAKQEEKPKPKDSAEVTELKSSMRRISAGIVVTTILMFCTAQFWPVDQAVVKNDAPPPAIGIVDTSLAVETVPTGTSSVPTFPKSIHLAEGNDGSVSMPVQGEQEYQLVGLGIRTVSFLGIQVYVVGKYVNTQDIATLQERLVRTQDNIATTLVAGEKGKLRQDLMDADKSEEIWNDILKDGNIRSVFRIVPTRNTDFAHLKDGFLRQITGKSQHFAASKNDQTFSDETFGESVNNFKTVMSSAPRKNLPKGEVLLLTRDAKGRMSAWYEDTKGARTKFGHIDDERVSRLIWLQYLSGKNPSSESARKSVVDGVMEYVERPVGTVAAQVV